LIIAKRYLTNLHRKAATNRSSNTIQMTRKVFGGNASERLINTAHKQHGCRKHQKSISKAHKKHFPRTIGIIKF